MKSNVLYLMIASVCLGLTACGGKSTRVTSSGNVSSGVPAQTHLSVVPSPSPSVIVTPTPVSTPTPTPTPVKSLVTQTSLGTTTLNIYLGTVSEGSTPFGTLSLSLETLNHSPGGDGHPVANDSVQLSPETFPVYFDSIRSDGLVISVALDGSTIQKIENPTLSDTHAEFKIPQSVCTHFKYFNTVGAPAFGMPSEINFNVSCSYSDNGTPTCHYDAGGSPANFPGGHPEFTCDQNAIIYPTSQSVEDFVKLKSLSINVLDDERDFSLPLFNPDTGEPMPNKIVHLNEEQIVFSL